MPILSQHFYHRTISLYCGVFGEIFNDMKILRDDGKLIKVPIAYAIKQKYDVRNSQNPDPNKARFKNQLPRFGFKMTSIQRDPNRSTNKMFDLLQKGVDRTLVTSMSTQKNRVPYNFGFQLNIKTKTLDDMLQLVEQILAYFNPVLRVTVEDNPDLSSDSSLTIKLESQTIEDIFEGSFENEQVLETTLDFTMEGWLYLPTNNFKIIKKVTVNYYDMDTNTLLETVVEE